MFKGRLVIWITVICLCLGIPYFTDKIPKWFETTDIFISSKIGDTNVTEKMVDNRYGDILVKSTHENADIIIASTTDDIPYNYTVKEDILYSPLVMYITASVESVNTGFIRINNTNSYKIDLMTILNAMEEGKSWQDIGINKNILVGKVTLCIPNKNSWYYKEVENLFYINLNGGRMPTNAEKTVLKPRVESLMDKCNSVDSIEIEIKKEANNQKETNEVYIAPECLFMTTEYMKNSFPPLFKPIYFTKTTFIYADFYINNNSHIANDFIDVIQSKQSFMEDTGWRIKNSTYDISKVSSSLMKVPH
jgi:hypothetical protein